MSKTRLYIIRHGETEFNKKGMMQGRGIDAPLNSTGKKQADRVADVLKNETVDQLVVSSMIRSIQTAQPLSKLLSMPIQSYDDLDEMNFGDLEGKRSKDIANELNHIHNEWASGNINYNIPGGESPVEVFERANGRIKSLLESGGETVVLILHGRLMRILLSKWLGYGIENMHKIAHANGSINQIEKNGRSFKAVYLNKIDHIGND